MRASIYLSLFTLIAALLVSLPFRAGAAPAAALAPAGVTLIASPVSPDAAVTQASLDSLTQSGLVVSSTPVFGPSEQAALRRMGQTELALSRKIIVRGDRAAEDLKTWAREKAPALRLDANSMSVLMETRDPQEPLQWGIANNGDPQSIYLSKISSLSIPGKAGEDIGLSRIPAEPQNPAKKVIVAVLDTGIDYEHPELSSRIVRKPKECEALEAFKACMKKDGAKKCNETLGSVDTDGNGYPMDCMGWNVTSTRNDVTQILGDQNADDDVGHGTHVAGVIGAAANGKGIRGVSQNVLLLPVKVISRSPNEPIRPQSFEPSPLASPSPSPSDNPAIPPTSEAQLKWSTGFADLLARGVLYAIRSDAQVINMSLAWPVAVDSLLMRRMVALAQSRGIVVVAAAGNDSTEARVMPCAYEGVVCVGAHGPDGAFSHFSNYGPSVDISAPGTRILSTWPLNIRSEYFTQLNGFEYKNGTSMASPFVAGAFARLIGMGFTPADAYARLLLGARPALPSIYRGPQFPEKYTRSGNLDLAGALRVTEQPLLLAARKGVTRIRWDRQTPGIPLKLSLKNFWKPATGVKVRAHVMNLAPASSSASLDTSEFAFDAIGSGETVDLETILLIDHPNVEGRLVVEALVECSECAPRLVRFAVDLTSPVSKMYAGPGAETLPIRGGAISPAASIRTIKSVDAGSGQDYLAMEKRGAAVTFQLLRQTSRSDYEIAATRSITLEPGTEFIQAQRLDADLDGTPEYSFLFRAPGPQGSQKLFFRFQFYNAALQPIEKLKTIEYDNVTSAVAERFQWMRIPTPAGPRLVPAWIGFGRTPDLEKPAYDPWDPVWLDTARTRFYYLAADGVRTLPEPKGQYYLQTLTPDREQRASGVVPVLMVGATESYRKDYSIALATDAKVGTPVALHMPGYRMLQGLTNLVEVNTLDSLAVTSTGTAFGGNFSSEGTLRATFVENVKTDAPVHHETLRPLVVTDSIVRMIGAYEGGGRRAGFGETHYDLEYLDFSSGESAVTSLNRFSFIPTFIFSKTMFPAVIASGGGRLPAVMIPAELGDADGMEIVAPAYDAVTKKLVGLTRPAALRLEAAEGCSLVGNPIDASADAPTTMLFLCGDHFVRVPLVQPN